MKIVIEIDNEHYERIMRLEEGVTVYPTTLALYEAVKNGTSLPKGHGRIIDESKIEVCEWVDAWEEDYPKASTDAPTIIDADGGGEDDIKT